MGKYGYIPMGDVIVTIDTKKDEKYFKKQGFKIYKYERSAAKKLSPEVKKYLGLK